MAGPSSRLKHPSSSSSAVAGPLLPNSGLEPTVSGWLTTVSGVAEGVSGVAAVVSAAGAGVCQPRSRSSKLLFESASDGSGASTGVASVSIEPNEASSVVAAGGVAPSESSTEPKPENFQDVLEKKISGQSNPDAEAKPDKNADTSENPAKNDTGVEEENPVRLWIVMS